MKKRPDRPHRRPKPRRNAAKPGPAPAAPVASPPTDWSAAADWYDQLVGEEGSEYHREIVLPGALRLLAAGPGDKVLDLACGQGVLCRLLASKGIHATGIDASPDLIKIAHQRNDRLRTANSKLSTPDYHVGDARHLAFLPPNQFHAAACLLAIQNIHPVTPVFQGVARVLQPWGRFVVVMMHPCFRGPKETSWGWDEQNTIQYRRTDRYLLPRKAPIVTNPGKSTDYTWTFHKPIQDYVKAARSAGLLIDALEEWPSHKTSGPGPRAAAENTARKEIPLFLALRAVKIPNHPSPSEGADHVENDPG
jgi:ubiquinone/menaquinone biosynthesis C-methylase UbiE